MQYVSAFRFRNEPVYEKHFTGDKRFGEISPWHSQDLARTCEMTFCYSMSFKLENVSGVCKDCLGSSGGRLLNFGLNFPEFKKPKGLNT